MNYKRLKDLALQAGYLPDMFTRGHWDCKEFHRFAELFEADILERIRTVGLINDHGEVLTLGTSWRINEE